MACTFPLLVGRKCGLDPRSKNQSCQVIPLVSCNKNITCHKKCLKFNGCDTEIELILAKSACFKTPVNIQEMTICPLHRERLGIGWALLETVKNAITCPRLCCSLRDILVTCREIGSLPE